MKRLATLLGFLVLGSVLAFGANWSGQLADANCKQATPDQACAISATTTAFGIVTADGKFLKFDAEGNEKAMTALKASSASAKGEARATVSGQLVKDTIKVENLKIEG